MLFVIEAVTDNKFVGDVEAHVVRCDLVPAGDILAEEDAGFDAQRVGFLA